MGKVMRHTLGASLNIRHNLSSSKGPKPLQLKLRSEERFSRNAETDLVCRLLLEKKKISALQQGSPARTLNHRVTYRGTERNPRRVQRHAAARDQPLWSPVRGTCCSAAPHRDWE